VVKATKQATAKQATAKKSAAKPATNSAAKPATKSAVKPPTGLAAFREKAEHVLERSDFAYMMLGFAYLIIYSVQVLVQPEPQAYAALEAVSVGIYIVFVIDLLVRIVIAGRALLTLEGVIRFIKVNWLAIAATLLPALRSLRVLRVIVVLRGVTPFMSSRANKLGMVVGVTLPLILYTAALSALEAERNAEGANILTFSDAIWWSVASVTTVGYGDRFPVTDDGRVTATLLLLVGIGLFSALTALLASWVMGERSGSDKK
jgi:voltage-gated potassium channel